MRNADRLFSIVDLKSRRLVGLCTRGLSGGSRGIPFAESQRWQALRATDDSL